MNHSLPSLGKSAAPSQQPASGPASSETPRSAIDISAFLQVLWRGKWLIAAVTLVAILLGGYNAFFLATPLYRSTSVVMLEPRQEQVVDLQSVVSGMSGDTAEINSEVEVLRSRTLVGKVVDQLDLIEDPEFNGALREPGLRTRLREAITGLFGDDAEAPAPAADPLAAQKTRDAVISSVLSTLTIRNVPLSLVFEITAQSESPTKATRIADAMAATYIRDQLDAKFEATEQATAWLTDRVTELQGELETAETRVQEFSASTDLVNQEALIGMERQLKDIRNRLADTTEDRAETLARIEAMEAAETRAARAEAAGDAQLTRMLDRTGTPEGDNAFDTRFQQVLSRARLDLNRLDDQLGALEQSETELARQIEQQNADLIQLQQLTREAEATRLLYEYFLTRLKETSAQQGIQQADSRLLSDAVVPRFPSEPRKSLMLVLSAFLGLLLGSAIVLLREARQNTYRSARELEAETGYTVMGQIPLIPARRRREMVSYLAEKPTSATAEAIRNLRTSVVLSNVDEPPQVIATTSSLPGEGKTTMAMALAQNFTGLGRNVLIIEGDVRRRVFSQYLDTQPEGGLVSVMTGDVPLERAVAREDRIGADILVGEKTATNAVDLFSSDSFARVMQEARALYDTVIIDTPPVLIVPDARVIAQQVDAMLFVVAWDRTTRPQVEDALHVFESAGQRISGLVLNQINPRGMKRYGYGGKYGSYAAYGRKYYVN